MCVCVCTWTSNKQCHDSSGPNFHNFHGSKKGGWRVSHFFSFVSQFFSFVSQAACLWSGSRLACPTSFHLSPASFHLSPRLVVGFLACLPLPFNCPPVLVIAMKPATSTWKKAPYVRGPRDLPAPLARTEYQKLLRAVQGLLKDPAASDENVVHLLVKDKLLPNWAIETCPNCNSVEPNAFCRCWNIINERVTHSCWHEFHARKNPCNHYWHGGDAEELVVTYM